MADFFSSMKKGFGRVASKVFGTAHERTMKKLRPMVSEINDLEPKIRCLSDAELKAKTAEFKEKIDNGATLDDLIIEAYACVREASMRTLPVAHPRLL